MKKLSLSLLLMTSSASVFADLLPAYIISYPAPQASQYYWAYTDKSANQCYVPGTKTYSGAIKGYPYGTTGQTFVIGPSDIGDATLCSNYNITFYIQEYNQCLNAPTANLNSATPAQNGASSTSTKITYDTHYSGVTYSINLAGNTCTTGTQKDPNTGNSLTYNLYACSLTTSNIFKCCYLQSGADPSNCQFSQ